MIKGTPQKKRDKRWHLKNHKRKARRANLRKEHLKPIKAKPIKRVVAEKMPIMKKPTWWQKFKYWFKKLFK